jgi:hypothetical protein
VPAPQIAPGGADTAVRVEHPGPPAAGDLPPLDSGAIAFNAPDRMQLGDIIRIQAVLQPGTDTASVRVKIEEAGPVRAHVIGVADSVEAQLKGGAFEINPLYPERRRLTRDRPIEWLWEVKPRSDGRQVLVLTVFAWLLESGSRDWVPIRTFRETIDVEVRPAPKTSPSNQIGAFVRDNWDKILTLLVIPLSAGLWRGLQRRRKKPGPPASAEDDDESTHETEKEVV